MIKAILLLVCLATTAFAQFPYHTNSASFNADTNATGDYDAFSWSWMGYDDQRINVNLQPPGYSNVIMRMSYPRRGKVFLDLTGTLAATNFTASIERTNLPPDGIYFCEFLGYVGDYTSMPARVLATGKVNIQHSLFQNTTQSTWTNPLAGTVIGPPFHTLSDLSLWPFTTTAASGLNSNEVTGLITAQAYPLASNPSNYITSADIPADDLAWTNKADTAITNALASTNFVIEAIAEQDQLLTYYVWGSSNGPVSGTKYATLMSSSLLPSYSNTANNVTNGQLIGAYSVRNAELPNTLQAGVVAVHANLVRNGAGSNRAIQGILTVVESNGVTVVQAFTNSLPLVYFPTTLTHVNMEISVPNAVVLNDGMGRMIVMRFYALSGWAGTEDIQSYSQDGYTTRFEFPGSSVGIYTLQSEFNSHVASLGSLAYSNSLTYTDVGGASAAQGALADATATNTLDLAGTRAMTGSSVTLARDVKSRDATSVGNFGAAFGNRAIAGNYGAAFGIESIAGDFGAAFGDQSAAGDYGAAFGDQSAAGDFGAAFGHQSTAGDYGFSSGFRALGEFGSFVFSDYGEGVLFNRTAYTNWFSVRASGGTYFETPDLSVTGTVTATSFTGSGSSLTLLDQNPSLTNAIDKALSALSTNDQYVLTGAKIAQAGGLTGVAINGTTGTVSGGVASLTIAAGGATIFGASQPKIIGQHYVSAQTAGAFWTDGASNFFAGGEPATNGIWSSPVNDPTNITLTADVCPVARWYGPALWTSGTNLYCTAGYYGGTGNSNIYVRGISGGSWQTTGAYFPLQRYVNFGNTVKIGDNYWCFGGMHTVGTVSSNIFYSLGSPTNWTTAATGIPASNDGSYSIASIGDAIYIYGGHNGSAAQTVIWYAFTNNPAIWIASPSTLPLAKQGGKAVIAGNKIIIAGGQTGRSFIADIGTPWFVQNTAGTAFSCQTAIVATNNNGIYWFGSTTASNIYFQSWIK